jgi:large subunit ribosomal protein L17
MRHNVFGKQLSRDTGQRQALLKGLAGALIRSEAIETTETKAKAAVSLIEKLIAKAKKGSLSDIRQIEEVIVDKSLVQKLVQEIAPRFKAKSGGFIKLVKLGNRVGDNASMVRMELVSHALPAETAVSESKSTAKVEAVKEPKKETKKAVSKKIKPASSKTNK